MKKPISKPPLVKRMIKKQHIGAMMTVTWSKDSLQITHPGETANDFKIFKPEQMISRITKKVIFTSKEWGINDNIEITLSRIVHQSDHDFNDEINETNKWRLQNLCKRKGMIFINNNSIDSTCLNRSKLHLNKSRTSLLIKNFSKAVNFVRLINEHDNGKVHNLTNSSIVSFSKVSYLSNLRWKKCR